MAKTYPPGLEPCESLPVLQDDVFKAFGQSRQTSGIVDPWTTTTPSIGFEKGRELWDCKALFFTSPHSSYAAMQPIDSPSNDNLLTKLASEWARSRFSSAEFQSAKMRSDSLEVKGILTLQDLANQKHDPAECWDSARTPGYHKPTYVIRKADRTFGTAVSTEQDLLLQGENCGSADLSFHEDSSANFTNIEEFSSQGEITASTEKTTPEAPLTTVMMRNLPSVYTGTMLVELLKKHGFDSMFDLVYLPMDYNSGVCFGYAFINFISADAALNFRCTFEGFSMWGLPSEKVCEVCWSNVLQGVEAHIERYRNSPVMHDMVPDDFKPMLFENGKHVPFPAPTKSIRPPRLRKKGTK